MRFLVAIFCLFSSISIFSQDKDFFERLHSTTVDKAIFFIYDGKQFHYRINLSTSDPLKYIPIEKGASKYFQVGNKHENAFKLYMAFYNPLQYNVSIASKEIEDTNYTALTNFINALPANSPLVSTISSSNAPKTFSIKNINKYNPSDKSKINEKLDVINRKIQELYSASPLLYDWVKIFSENIKVDKLLDPIYNKAFDDIFNTINGIKEVETFMYSDIEFAIDRGGAQSSVLNVWIKNAHDELYKSKLNDLELFKQKLKNSQEVAKTLTEKSKNAESKITDIRKLFSGDFVQIASMFDEKNTQDNNAFQDLTKSKLTFIEAMYTDKLQAHINAINNLSKLNEKLQKSVDKYSNGLDASGYKSIEKNSFKWEYKKGREYELSAVQLSQSGEEVSNSKTSIKVKVFKSQGRISFFPSAGLFYTPFEYKNYGISEGIVSETQGDPVYFRPAAYLNILYRWNSDIIYPMFQVGVTQGLETPLFPIGVGFSLRDKFSVTAGPLLAFQNRLDKLSVGDMSDDAGLKDDINSKIKASFYISINYKIGK